jgi:hypothetical protein
MTIQKAIDAAIDGDTVLVAVGTYAESIVFKGKSLSLLGKYPFTRDSADLKGTIIDAISGSDCAIRMSGVSRFKGFSVRNGRNGGVVANGPSTLANLLVSGNQGNGVSFTASGGTYHLAEDLIVSGNTGDGIREHLNIVMMRNVYSHSNAGNGFNFDSGIDTLYNCVSINNRSGIRNGSYMELSYSTIKSNTYAGLELVYGLATVRNSIIWENVAGIRVFESRVILRNNCIQGGRPGLLISDTAYDWVDYRYTNTDANPLFEGSGQFDIRLSAASPLISKATYDYRALEDYFHSVRAAPVGSIPDIGAHEHPTGTATWTVVISSFSPLSAREGWQVEIRGKGFEGASFVSFGGVTAPSFRVVSDSLLLATVGSGSSGSITVAHPVASPTANGFTHLGPPLPDINHNRFIHVKLSGVDNGSTGTASQPFQSLAAAIRYAQTGDTILLHPGTYLGEITTVGKRITIVGSYIYTGRQGSIDSTVIDGGYAGNNAVTLRESELRGVSVIGGYPYGVLVGGTSGGNLMFPNRIADVSVKKSMSIGVAFFAPSGSVLKMKSVTLSQNKSNGFHHHLQSVFLENVRSINNGGWGFWLQSGIDTLINCVSIGNGQAGIYCWNSQSKVEHSAFLADKQYGIRSHEGNLEMKNSIIAYQTNPLYVSGNGRISVSSSVVENGRKTASLDGTPETNLTYDTTNFFRSPYSILQDPNNLNLPDTSIAIGAASSSLTVKRDLFDSKRPNPDGTSPDIGPVESPLGKRVDPGCVSFSSSFNPLSDTLRICGDSIVLDAKSDYQKISWSNGVNAKTMTAKVSGLYRLKVQDQLGCSASDSVYVSLLSAKIIQNDTTLCAPGSLRISASVGADRFVYNGNLYQTSRQRKSLPWGPEDVVTGATSSTDGTSNTRVIVNKLGSYLQGNYAARYCDTLTEAGFDDWFLPASQETRVICSSVSSITALGSWTGYLHTSTEESMRDATRIYVAPPYGCGSVAAPFKNQSEWFLPVRKVSRFSFRWSTGDTTQSITVNPTLSTVYILTVSDGLNSCSDTFRVNITQGGDYNPFPDRLYSRADSIVLDAGAGQATYRWSTGENTRNKTVRNTGGYRANVTNSSGCSASDSVFVQFPDTVNLMIPNISATCNRSVDVPVRVTAFRNLLTMQGSVNWNSADLRFDSIASFGPASLAMNAGNFGVTQTSSGRLTFSWNDPAGKGVSLSDSTALFILRFSALGTNARSVPVAFTGNPTPLEFYDAGLVKKSFVLTQGSVNIACEINITGKVLTPSDNGVRNARLTLAGGSSTQTAVTDTLGNYSFKALPGSYTLTPDKNNEKNRVNGVSTLDLSLIQAHILQSQPLNAAYKVIAADADNSSSVSTVDILFLRRLILGTDTSLPGNRTWAFVDADQTFSNITNPFPFQSSKTLTNLSGDVTQRFRAIKVGDVNYDRNPMLDQAASGDTLRLYYDWTEAEDGQLSLRLRTRSVSGLMGFQGTLQWDAQQLMLDRIVGNPVEIGIGERWRDEGYLTFSWNDPRARGLTFSEGMPLLELRFRKSPSLQNASLTLTDDRLAREAFNTGLQSVGMVLQSGSIGPGVKAGVVRVFPNPAGRQLHVEWRSEARGEATVRLLDATGRLVHVHRAVYEAGVNRHVIRREGSLSSSGTWLVQVETGGVVRNVPVVMSGQEPRP